MSNTLREACEAGVAYDAAIRRKTRNGEVSLLATGGGVATGDDLDSLYDDWIAKTLTALTEPPVAPKPQRVHLVSLVGTLDDIVIRVFTDRNHAESFAVQLADRYFGEWGWETTPDGETLNYTWDDEVGFVIEDTPACVTKVLPEYAQDATMIRISVYSRPLFSAESDINDAG